MQFSCSTTDNSKIKHQEYNVAAYVWPSCHHDERFGDMLWPEKIGEWEVINKGTPRFEGHYQPRLPLWGQQMDSLLNVPLFPCVSVGWDATPRFPAQGIHDVVHYHNTPESFAALLSKAKEYADSHPEQPKLIPINAWDEWVEGSYLLPDMEYGFEYLEKVKMVMEGDYDP